MPAAKPQGSKIPLPKPQIIILVAGKGFPNVSLQLAGVGLKPLEKSRGRKEGWKEGRMELCLLLAALTKDGLPRDDMALPQGAAGSEGARKQKQEQLVLRDRDLSAHHPSHKHLHQHHWHPSSLFSPRILPAPSSLSTPSRAGMMTTPAPCGAPGQDPSIKPFPAARAGAGSRRSIDLIKPCAIHPRFHDSSS